MSNILVTGATGYIGGRLVNRLLEADIRPTCMVRNKAGSESKTWHEKVDIVEADVLKPETLPNALKGVDTAYYLIHSMETAKGDFENRDLKAAKNFAEAAKDAGVRHIIYLGGLGNEDKHLSKHLKSRQETGRALASTGLPVTEFRAAIIVGSGSISFEMIRYLTERLPVMVTPKWVDTKVQPIAVRDVLAYLVEAKDHQPKEHHIVEIGSPEVMTYKDMILGYARARELKRVMIPVPVLSPRISSYWVNLITPIPAAIARPLIDGLGSEVIVEHPEAAKAYNVDPMRYEKAVELALDRSEQGAVETLWHQSYYEPVPVTEPTNQLEDKEGLLVDKQVRHFPTSQDAAFKAISQIGGQEGWYAFTWLWHLRGLIDRLFGGIGMRRGRRSPDELVAGDILDFWRVETIKAPDYLQLKAEMKLPGRAWLRFDLSPKAGGQTEVKQTAFYEPKGLLGFLYWWAVYPFHLLLFPAMLRAIEKRASELESSSVTT